MKDAYSFHTSQECLDKEYENMANAYKRIFERCGLETKMVQSDSGAIGGSVSHEFMVLTNTEVGENDVFYCNSCDYSANSNHCISRLNVVETDGGFSEQKTIETPNTKTIEDLVKFFNIEENCILKSVLYIADSKPVMVMIRGDKEVEETKLSNALSALEIRPATGDEVFEHLGCEAGYISFLDVDKTKVKIIFDLSASGMKNFVIGANKKEHHIVGYNFCDMPEFIDVSLVKKGEFCNECGSPLEVTRGIEVGNIFQLGTKYSAPMEATFADINGKNQPYVMGCYGIGVTRTASAAIERYHDEYGIIWPKEIAPYQVDVIPVNIDDELQMKEALKIYNELNALGIDTIIDDRKDRAGVKFKDSELIGFPFRITVGKTIQEGLVEFKQRGNFEMEKITVQEAIEKCKNLILS